MLTLKDFISGTLQQLIDGTIEAQAYATQKGARINPGEKLYFNFTDETIKDNTSDSIGQFVGFDIAITAVSGDQTKGGIGIFVSGITLGVSGQTEFKDSSVSRMKFKLPVFLPIQTVPLKQPASQLHDIPAEKSRWMDKGEA
jgi:hypothetical protein